MSKEQVKTLRKPKSNVVMPTSEAYTPHHQWTVIGAIVTASGVIAPQDNKRTWYANEEAALEYAQEITKRLANKGNELQLVVMKAAYLVSDSPYEPAKTEKL